MIDRTKTMDDVYGAFFDFACMLKTKVYVISMFSLSNGSTLSIFGWNFSNALVYFVFMLVFNCFFFCMLTYVNRWTRTIQMPWKHLNDWKPSRKSAEKMETFTRGDFLLFLVSSSFFFFGWSSNESLSLLSFPVRKSYVNDETQSKPLFVS